MVRAQELCFDATATVNFFFRGTIYSPTEVYSAFGSVVTVYPTGGCEERLGDYLPVYRRCLFKVHFDGWAPKWDEWVDGAKLIRPTHKARVSSKSE